MLIRLVGLLSMILIVTGCCCSTPRPICRPVQYINNPCSPCSSVCYPGFRATDFSCLERMKRLSAVRCRGVGVIVLGDRLRFILPTDNFFVRDTLEGCTPEICECELATLADIAAIIKCLPCVPICVSGHTDNVGTKRDRIRKSRAIVQVIAGNLWAQGIAWERMRLIADADNAQIASDQSVFGSTDNRRVEIRLDFSGNYRYNRAFNNNYCPDCIPSTRAD